MYLQTLSACKQFLKNHKKQLKFFAHQQAVLFEEILNC